MPNLKEKVAKGAVWTLMEKVSRQAVGFVVGMILARLLTPTDYGTVALTTIFFAVAGVLVDGIFCAWLPLAPCISSSNKSALHAANVLTSVRISPEAELLPLILI